MEKEIYIQFKNTNYSVSNLGNIRNNKSGKKLNPSKTSNGYRRVSIYKDKKRTNHLLHRLVAECFLSDWCEELTVNHIDGIKDNNSIHNLEMVSLADNIKHSYEVLKRKANSCNRHINQYTKEGKFIKSFISIENAAKSVKRSATAISNAANGITKSSAGYHWEFRVDYNNIKK